MAGSVNKVILIGNLGRDPEVRRMNDGNPVVSFSLATTESWRDKMTGERRDRTEWHNIVIFNENLANIAEQYCKKGSKIYLEGQLQTREYQDRDGNQRRTTEIVLQRFRGELTLLDSRNRDDAHNQESGTYGQACSANQNFGQQSPTQNHGGAPAHSSMKDYLADDIPFGAEFR